MRNWGKGSPVNEWTPLSRSGWGRTAWMLWSCLSPGVVTLSIAQISEETSQWEHKMTVMKYLLQSLLGLYWGISHFHIPHQPACCPGGARTGSGTHAARENDECYWNGGRWSCILCGHIPFPNELRQYGKWVVRGGTVQGLLIPSDCHRRRGSLREGRGAQKHF